MTDASVARKSSTTTDSVRTAIQKFIPQFDAPPRPPLPRHLRYPPHLPPPHTTHHVQAPFDSKFYAGEPSSYSYMRKQIRLASVEPAAACRYFNPFPITLASKLWGEVPNDKRGSKLT